MVKLKLPAGESEQNGLKRVIPFNKGNNKGNVVFGKNYNMKSTARKMEIRWARITVSLWSDWPAH